MEKKTILIADDEEDFLKAMSIRIKTGGYTPVLARDGLELLDITNKKIPDLIILDVQMPNMDGLAALKELKKSPDTAKIPIIILTAGAFDFSEELDALAEAQDFVLKTVDSDQIMKKIKELIN